MTEASHHGGAQRARVLTAFALSVVILALGVAQAAARYPDGYDWAYTVISALASRKHNPEGAVFFAGALSLSLALLWPVVGWGAGSEPGLARFGRSALRVGIVLGVIVGFERLAFFHFSEVLRKGHEGLALLCFLCTYAGVLALFADRLRRRVGSRWPVLCALAPLVAIGLSQLALYFDQRDLGWVDRSWREMGIPLWLSFAFWQWLAVTVLWASIGLLAASAQPPPRGGRES